jgi:hypothetical protein
MDEVIKFLKMWFLIVVCFLFTWGLIFINHVDKQVSDLSQSIEQTTEQTNTVLSNMNAILLSINRPCGTGQPCGTLADVAKTLGTIRGTAGQLEIAAHHEDARLDALDAQETALYGDTHKLLARGSTALETANATIAGLQPVEAQLNLEAKQLNVATANLNVLLTNPDIPAAIGSTNSALGHINATVADTQQAVHAWLHPTWPRKLWNGIQEFSVDIGRVLF